MFLSCAPILFDQTQVVKGARFKTSSMERRGNHVPALRSNPDREQDDDSISILAEE